MFPAGLFCTELGLRYPLIDKIMVNISNVSFSRKRSHALHTLALLYTEFEIRILSDSHKYKHHQYHRNIFGNYDKNFNAIMTMNWPIFTVAIKGNKHPLFYNSCIHLHAICRRFNVLV